MKREPTWTICYNIKPCDGEIWLGDGWEFFDHEKNAQYRYNELLSEGHVPTMRPYYRKTDEQHLHFLQRPKEK